MIWGAHPYFWKHPYNFHSSKVWNKIALFGRDITITQKICTNHIFLQTNSHLFILFPVEISPPNKKEHTHTHTHTIFLQQKNLQIKKTTRPPKRSFLWFPPPGFHLRSWKGLWIWSAKIIKLLAGFFFESMRIGPLLKGSNEGTAEKKQLGALHPRGPQPFSLWFRLKLELGKCTTKSLDKMVDRFCSIKTNFGSSKSQSNLFL